jgi:hypothetical protein
VHHLRLAGFGTTLTVITQFYSIRTVEEALACVEAGADHRLTAENIEFCRQKHGRFGLLANVLARNLRR